MDNKTIIYMKLELLILSCKRQFIARRKFISLHCDVDEIGRAHV
jgi:hypothetical protein